MNISLILGAIKYKRMRHADPLCQNSVSNRGLLLNVESDTGCIAYWRFLLHRGLGQLVPGNTEKNQNVFYFFKIGHFG